MVKDQSGDPFAQTVLQATDTAERADTVERVSRARPTAPATRVDADSVPAPGTHVGRFVLERKLGEGGMGMVFGALDVELQRAVALKILRPGDVGTDGTEAQARMLREAQAMAMVSHPNLATVFEVGVFRKDVFLAMEYVKGETLEVWLRGNHSIEDKMEVFAQAGQALQAIHDAGLVHRDFKPANVMVRPDASIKVLDLGIARRVVSEKALDRVEAHAARKRRVEEMLSSPHNSGINAFESQLTQEGAIIGTPAYMAPEQLMGAEVGPPADQFSFAVALFEALTGVRPFAGENQIETMANILAGETRSWPEDCEEVPVRLRRVVERGLSPEPTERFASITEFVQAAEGALGLRGQIRALTRRWLSHASSKDYLLPECERLQEGRELLTHHPEVFSDEQKAFLRASIRGADRRRLVRRGALVVLATLLLGLVPILWLLERRSEQLELATQAEVRAHISAVRREVESIFARDGQRILTMYEQRAVWMPWVRRLREGDSEGHEDLDARLTAAVVNLNHFFRPVVEHAATISSLMVASGDGFEYLIFDDTDAAKLKPPYRLYNRVTRGREFADAAFQLFWAPGAGGGAPRASWLHLGSADSRGQVWTGYQPATRPWFKVAVARANPELAWTTPYLFFVTKDAGITGSIAWEEDGRRYVFAVDLMLTDISHVTAHLDDEGFLAFVTTGEAGEIVGLPRDEGRFTTPQAVREFFVHVDEKHRAAEATAKQADVAARLPTTRELGIPVVAAAFEAGKQTTAAVFAVPFEGTTLWAGRSPVGNPEQDLMVYVVERPD